MGVANEVEAVAPGGCLFHLSAQFRVVTVFRLVLREVRISVYGIVVSSG
jgi:hypothetical protein